VELFYRPEAADKVTVDALSPDFNEYSGTAYISKMRVAECPLDIYNQTIKRISRAGTSRILVDYPD
jgi:hypothetical protein